MLETEIELNGTKLILEYDWDAQIKAEEMTGINILFPQGVSASALVRATFLARLLKHQPGTTVDQVSKLMPLNMGKISNALNSIGEFQEPDSGVEMPLVATDNA